MTSLSLDARRGIWRLSIPYAKRVPRASGRQGSKGSRASPPIRIPIMPVQECPHSRAANFPIRVSNRFYVWSARTSLWYSSGTYSGFQEMTGAAGNFPVRLTNSVYTYNDSTHGFDSASISGVSDAAGAPLSPCSPGSCSDTNVRTDDLCNLALGCEFLANTDSCDDGNACSEGDVCAGGLPARRSARLQRRRPVHGRHLRRDHGLHERPDPLLRHSGAGRQAPQYRPARAPGRDDRRNPASPPAGIASRLSSSLAAGHQPQGRDLRVDRKSGRRVRSFSRSR